MTTGDMRNNLKKLQREAKLLHFPEDLDYDGLGKGDPEAHLPVLYHTFFDYSPTISQNLAGMGYSLSGKRGVSLITLIFKVMREKNAKMTLNLKVAQFMSKGFAERKVILTASILNFVRTNLKTPSAKKRTVHSKCNHTEKSPDARVTHVAANPAVSAVEMIPPDMSCVKLDDNATPAQPRDEVPMKEMQSTTISSVLPRHQVVPEKILDLSVANDPTISQYKAPEQVIGCGPTLLESRIKSRLPSGELISDGDDNDRIKSMQIHGQIVINRNLQEATSELTKRVSALETKNDELLQLYNDQEAINKMLLNRIENLSERLESKISENQRLPTRSHSEKSGNRLSGHGLQSLSECKMATPSPNHDGVRQHASLHSRSYDNSADASAEVSLCDITNDSPTRERGGKLFELVRDTRSMLGMDVNTPKMPKSNAENLLVSEDDIHGL